MSMLNIEHLRMSAAALYKQRNTFLCEKFVESEVLTNIELQLKSELYLIASNNKSSAKKSEFPKIEILRKSESEVFLDLAIHILNSDKTKLSNIYHEIIKLWLRATDNENAFYNVLVLFSTSTLGNCLKKHYKRSEDAKVKIFNLWKNIRYSVSSSYLKVDIYSNNGESLQEAIMLYASEDRRQTVEYFRYFYQPLVEGDDTHYSAKVIAPAIWAGMIRGDELAYSALKISIDREQYLDAKFHFLRLAALSGRPEYNTAIRNSLRTNQSDAYYLLFLYGRSEVFNDVINGLRHPDFNQIATLSWRGLSEQVLSKLPRLRLVGDLDQEEMQVEIEVSKYDTRKFRDLDLLLADIEAVDKLVPDVAEAEKWAKRVTSGINANQRFHFGKIDGFSELIAHNRKWAAVTGVDLMALLSVHLNRPLPSMVGVWAAHKLEFLNTLVSTGNAKTEDNIAASGKNK